MNNYVSSSIVGGLGVICIALALLYIDARRYAYLRAMRHWKSGVEEAQAENKRIDIEATLNLCYADGLLEEIEQLNNHADLLVLLNADLHDALLDAQNQIKALRMATVEIPSAKIPARPKPKSTTRKKAAS